MPFTEHPFAVPLMANSPHQQSTVKLDRATGESRLVFKVAGFDFFDGQRLHVPIETVKHELA